jgi:hypothetical protein
MISTINSFAVPILSFAIVALCGVVFHLNRKLNRAVKLIPANYLMDVCPTDKKSP